MQRLPEIWSGSDIFELVNEFLSDSITKITAIMEHFTENDPDWKRSSQAKIGVLDIVSCYRELLRERQLKKRQSSLYVYFKKQPKHEEGQQSGPSSQM